MLYVRLKSHIATSFLLLFSLMFANVLQAQGRITLQGNVQDENGKPLPGASVFVGEKERITTTDGKGYFVLKNLNAGTYPVTVSFIGYRNYIQSVVLKTDETIDIQMIPETWQLGEVSIKENRAKTLRQEDSRNIEVVDNNFMRENQSGSLMQTLSRLPGISSIDIGSGQSKPVIRGLSFNRVVVAENGIKHEGQEWGADHGLEIDQYGIERVEVVKGPASLMYGSNAIGGVIDLKQLAVPAIHNTGGSVDLDARSNNNLLGGSASFFNRGNKFYLKTRFTITNYADYKVPTDSIEYLSYYFKLKDRMLRNTAGNEINGNFTAGFVNDGFSTHLTVSDFFSKSGFFANAHGLEIRTSTIDYDRSARDIDLPYQQVNHLKILSNTNWAFSGYTLNVDMAFQDNFRKEFAEANSHGYMPIPPDTLERQFRKGTWSLNAKLEFPTWGIHRLTAGTNTEYQQNNIGGWGFILPAFESLSSGAFLYDKLKLSDQWIVNAGVRYDIGTIETEPYSDWYATPQADGSETYVLRAAKLERTFNNLTWALGANYNANPFAVKINFGKSFRMPIAKELASNGINYHMYRYEKGDSSLHAEVSYQADLGISWSTDKWDISLSPFVNYFPNYIYLNPTSKYHEGLQVYYHRESEVFRTGGELSVSYEFLRNLTAGIDAEYIYSVQFSGEKRGFTLPFSPPFSSVFSLKYAPKGTSIFIKPEFSAEYKVVADQNKIVPPEKKTNGYQLVNITIASNFKISKQLFRAQLQVQNIFDTKYYDHTSFYRLIEVPGPGRNISLSVHIPINSER
jgi:iron complex outermembrane recepter protein